MMRYPFAARLTGLLVIDVGLSLLYALIPPDLTIARTALSYTQLAFMVAIMVFTIRRVLEDF